MVPLKGYGGFGSQCLANGTVTLPKKVKLELWACPIPVETVELAEPLTPLFLSADCGRKILTIRTADYVIDDSWEVMPDGSFYLTQEKLFAKLKNDGSGNNNCVTPLSADLWGRIDCTNRDQATIMIEARMWLNKKTAARTPAPGAVPSGTPGAPPPLPMPIAAAPVGPECKLPPAQCYLHTVTSVQQCQ